MPKMMREIKAGTREVSHNISYEILAASWLMQEGWEVYMPLLDHHKTDILIAEGQRYYRIQVKTVASDTQCIENKWKDSSIHYVLVFVRKNEVGSEFFGCVMPAFSENTRRLDHKEHYSFKSKTQFLKAFRKLPAP